MPEKEDLEKLASYGASMAIFLSVQNIDGVVEKLKRGYKRDDVPVAVVYKATWEDEKIVKGTLMDISFKVKEAEIKSTAQILIGDKIVNLSKHDSSFVNEICHYKNSSIEGGIKNILKDLIQKYDGIVFISAIGIAVRMMTPYIKDKRYDPAVVVVDDMARYSISLLSGHIGGANTLCEYIGNAIGAMPIITTASDARGIESIDMYAKRMNLHIEDMEDVKNITSMMVNGKKIGFYSEINGAIKYNNLVYLSNEDINLYKNDMDGVICVTSNENVDIKTPHCILRPKNLNIGIGCKKGISGYRIIESIRNVFKENNLSEKSLKSAGTIEIKKDEQGIIEACKYFKLPLKIFTKEEIQKVENKFEKSEFVKSKIGVYSVCEPCAYLLGGQIVVNKKKVNGITIAVSKEEYNG